MLIGSFSKMELHYHMHDHTSTGVLICDNCQQLFKFLGSYNLTNEVIKSRGPKVLTNDLGLKSWG